MYTLWTKTILLHLTKECKRMQLLFKAAKFTNSKEDLKSIYITYVRSVIEQSSVVWHSSLSKKNRKDLERIQKAAVKVIMGRNYSTYKEGLKKLKLDDLNQRREKLCLSFAKKCLKNEKVKDICFLWKKVSIEWRKEKAENFKMLKPIQTDIKNQLFHTWQNCSMMNMKKNAQL